MTQKVYINCESKLDNEGQMARWPKLRFLFRSLLHTYECLLYCYVGIYCVCVGDVPPLGE